MQPLQVLFEADGLPRVELPRELERLHGGGLGFDSPAVYANFVTTLDGVAAIPSLVQSNKLVSAGSEEDRFLMGVLRAFASAVVIGSGTLHGSPRGRWEADSPLPLVDEQLAEVRVRLGLPPVPELAVLTRSGALDVEHPVLERGVLVVTTDAGAAVLRDRVPRATTIESLGDDVEPHSVVALLRGRGHELVLSEAGPTVFGAFLEAGMIDEVFLTLSPLVAGHAPGAERLSLVEGAAWVPGEGPSGRLLSARRAGSHLFLRYSLS